MNVTTYRHGQCEQAGWCDKDAEQGPSCPFAGSGSLCSSQTLAPSLSENCSQRTSAHAPQGSGNDALWSVADAGYTSSADMGQPEQPACQQPPFPIDFDMMDEPDDLRGPAYAACVEMIRCHKQSEAAVFEVTARLAQAEGAASDDGSRMIVVSWLVEVAEEFGLQQETLHAAVALLDRFLATSQGVPRCVLQLVAVGCTFLASKQLQVHHPNVEQMVAVAAHSFTAADLLRVERILLDALHFNISSPTAYAFLHLLTQATLAAEAAAGTGGNVSMNCSSRSGTPETADQQQAAAADGASGPAMEVAVSLAMYLTELALLDTTCLAFPGSHIATAALLLAHATLSQHCEAWPVVLAAAGLTEAEVAAALAALGRLHVAAAVPPSPQLAELLQPLQVKFGQDCWCRVSLDVLPLALQGSTGEAAAPMTLI